MILKIIFWIIIIVLIYMLYLVFVSLRSEYKDDDVEAAKNFVALMEKIEREEAEKGNNLRN